jgi:hypothetical protein
MNTELFGKFNEMFDIEGLQKDIEEAASGQIERKEVPFGDYEVKVTKLELGEHQFDDEYKGMPIVNIWFKIIGNGEYAGQMLFVTKRLISLKNPSASGFMIHKVNEFIDSLESGIPVTFEDWEQYGELLSSIAKAVSTAEYQLSFFKTDKGYKDYAVVKRFQ